MKLIPLLGKKGKGRNIQVDDEDYNYLSRYKCYTHSGKHTDYAYANYHKDRVMHQFIMHRVIMQVTDPKMVVDHIDGNGLNNQRSNLRVCSISENNLNRRSETSSRSKYKGVSPHEYRSGTNPNNKKLTYWRAYCTRDDISYHKLFKTEIEAALQYNEWAKELHGEFARLNKI